MASKDFSATLKELRINAGFSQKQVYEMLDVRQSTFSAWETGRAEPSADMLLKLCKLYKIDDISAAFGHHGYKEDGSLQLNIREVELIEKYRDLDDHGKEHINTVLGWERERAKLLGDKNTQLSDLHQQLNIRKLQSRLRLYTYMGKIACAGTSFYFDDIPTDTIEAPYMTGADFIIGVSGDSMEPSYHDGEKLYIQKVRELTLGDIGIFTIRNECFIKELGERGLISRNPDYDDIKGTEDIRLIGRVLGKVEE